MGSAVDYYTHRGRGGEPDLWENETLIESPGYMTDQVTDRSVSFITRHAANPFFIEVSYTAVHYPFQPPDRSPDAVSSGFWQGPDSEPPPTHEDYARMLQRADEGVGEILAALDRSGIVDNTLVIFTNDNGGEWLSRQGPLFHRKGSVWEGGIRVPLILRWPDHLPADTTSSQVAITMDLTASILAATGTAVPPALELEGIDLLPILQGETPLVERQLFWRVPRRDQMAVRLGDWKLVSDGGELLLFSLPTDPGERRDLAAQHPDVVRRAVELLEAWEQEVAAP